MSDTAPSPAPGTSDWADPVMVQETAAHGPEPDELLRTARASPDRCVFVLGLGFDPRCAVGLERYISATGHVPKVVAIHLAAPAAAPLAALAKARDINTSRIRALAGARLSERPFPSLRDPAGTGRAVAKDLDASGLLDGAGQIVVDISALPTAVALPLARMLLDRCKETDMSPELQLVVVENPALDALITEQGLRDAAALPGFNAQRLAASRTPGQVRAWAPVVGEGAGQALAKVAAFLEPDEVNPVLPFPATDPRRADQLFIEHRGLLVDTYQVGAGSVLYADERNPFDLARTLVRWHDDMTKALEPLGLPPLMCLSAHSSKLLSGGVLLAAYQREMPIVTAGPTSYALEDTALDDAVRAQDRLAVLWLRGDPYRV